ncbi:MAG TPA: aminoglycoside phosphotransferase family protein [Chitinophagaceae bacterium]|nr:aminoglycoside phosphotransferase family protein [Chitinophagaceae bacterium]
MLETILKEFGIDTDAAVRPFGSGLINNTWIIEDGEKEFILQRINHNVFKRPEDIATNISLIGDYLEENHPGYLFVFPSKTISGELMIKNDEGYFRLFPFIKNSHTTDVVNSPSQAYEAARQFGRFTSLLSGFPVEELKLTIPGFHNLPLRYAQFESALQQGNQQRIKEASTIISFLKEQYGITSISEQINHNPGLKKRVTHHDTKISNVLFDENEHGLCVIDLDTVMPGYFISDVGDMMRTYLSPVSDEEKDFSKIEIRDDYFKAIADGYLDEMENELTATEKKHMVYSGKFIICMQALRYLTDFLNNDTYYGAKYEGHNLIRATNQATLLKKIIEKEKLLQEIIEIKL